MINKLPPLPSIGDIVKLYGLSAKQQLSQNFILDMNLCKRIAKTCGNLQNSTVIEVGSGPGNLTRALFIGGAKHVICVEKDERFLPALELLREAVGKDKMSIVLGDAMDVDEGKLLKEQEVEPWDWDSEESCPIHIVGNLPFSVSTALLLKWIKQMPKREGAFSFGRCPLTLLFQKEVAYRLFATPGCREFSRLSVMSQNCAQVIKKFDIKGKAFVPPPNVDSGVVTLIPRVKPLTDVSVDSLEYVLMKAFGQKRKMLRNAIQMLEFGNEILAEANIDEEKRCEQITIKEWGMLTRLYEEKKID